MKKLEELRSEIDDVDSNLVKLLARRMALADEVAAVKHERGAVVTDLRRERQILTSLSNAVEPDLARGVRTVYATIFNVSKARQRLRVGGDAGFEASLDAAAKNGHFPELANVACAGDDGSFAQQAASRMFAVPTILYFNNFEKVFEAVEKGLCPYGVLPIENSSAGSVAAVYDLMQHHSFRIVRALKLKVEHVLLAPEGVKLSDVKTVKSHPHALAQCSGFFKANAQIKTEPSPNTAIAARLLAASGAKDTAVVASRECAELYNLKVIAENIANSAYNYTRFICISRELELYPKANKSSVMFALEHRPGALNEIISKFAAIGVNLTKLESRPVAGSAFEFRFVFEFDSTPANLEVRALLAEIAADPAVAHFTFLGAYEEM